LDIRSLRAFVAVAEELHFTRAAARLFVAQQALSRDVRNLEERVGTPLFVRTTRRVTLTPEGRRLLERSRPLLRLHDEVVAELVEPSRAVIVDLMSEGRRTAVRVLDLARQLGPTLEFRGRYHDGMGVSGRLLESAELDVAFGRVDWQGRAASADIASEVIRYEPIAVLLPHGHPLAAGASVSCAQLEGVVIDAPPTSARAPEWADLVRQFLALTGALPAPDHEPAVGLDDQAHHLVRQGIPILTTTDHVPIPGGVLLPVVDPVPIYTWSMAWRTGAHPAGLAAITDAAHRLARQEGWLDLPAGAWLPEPEAPRTRGRSSAARPSPTRTNTDPR
jgi:DNA-binding transcriptional LysR family regulator